MAPVSYLSALLDAAFRLSIDYTQFFIFLAIVVLEIIAIFLPKNLKPKALQMSAKITTGRVALIALIAVIGTRLIVAPYWVWKDEREGRIEAEAKLAKLTNRNTTKQQLSVFYAEGQRLAENGAPSHDEAGVEKYHLAIVEWRDRVSKWLDENMSQAASPHFRDYQKQYAGWLPGFQNTGPQETWDRNYVRWLCENLDGMILSDAWDKAR